MAHVADFHAQVEELSQNLEFRASDLEQQSQVSGSGLRQTVDTLLHSDDKLLLSLRKLGLELEEEDPEDRANVEKLREICMRYDALYPFPPRGHPLANAARRRLIKYTVETVRTKLDRLYLEALSAAHRGETAPTPSDDAKSLQDELESLYSEILSVAQMSVEQQYLEPALKSLSNKNGQSLGRTAAAVVYVSPAFTTQTRHTF